jgi:hypothetical protein
MPKAWAVSVQTFEERFVDGHVPKPRIKIVNAVLPPSVIVLRQHGGVGEDELVRWPVWRLSME